MIVDCHTHINDPSNDVHAAEYLDACQKVSSCIVLAGISDDCARTNKQLAEYTSKHSKLTGFARINPLTEKLTPRNIKALTIDQNLKGVVLYCCDDKFHPAHSNAMRLYEILEEMSIPVFFHNIAGSSTAVLAYAQPYLLDEIAAKFPSLKLIVGNMGLPFFEQTLSLAAKHENVYADLTILPAKIWRVYNVVLGAYEAVIMDKLLFGSGYPASRADQCIETLLGFNKLLADTNLPTVPREQIRGIIERDSLALLGISA